MSVKDFILLSKLGQGAYSTVYKVQRLADHQIYALKKVKLGNLSDKQAQNALNQVRILASIHHQNIISYKQAFLEGKSLCIVMEFADDGDLYHKISDSKKKKKYFYENFIWKLIINMLRGLKELHDLKILHRDIKTANIFLNKKGTAQLGDMNVSKIAENGLLYTQTGTPYYASPQVWSQSPYDSKSDIWSLGCVLYETAALEVPFKAEDMEGLMNTVLTGKFQPIPNIFSKQLSQFISQMLQLKPKQRPSCQRMLNSNIIQSKIEQLNLETNGTSKGQKQLLQTIRMPKKFQYLTDRLPKSNYSLNKSYDEAIYTIEQSKKKSRERTNTLPKLQRVIRYHQEIIHKRKKGNNQSSTDNKNVALYVAGISKSINEIKVGLPDRKDRINQEISRIYQGKHAVHRNQNSRDYNLLGMRK